MRRFRTRIALYIAPWLYTRTTVPPLYTTTSNAAHYTVIVPPSKGTPT